MCIYIYIYIFTYREREREIKLPLGKLTIPVSVKNNVLLRET